MKKENFSMLGNNITNTGVRIFYYLLDSSVESINNLETDEYFFKEVSGILKKNDIINIVYEVNEQYFSKQIIILSISIVKGVVKFSEIKPVLNSNENDEKNCTTTIEPKKTIRRKSNGTNK